MKNLLIFASLISIQAQAGALVDHLFVPRGFDNNDNVEVVVTGKFPNPCFSSNKVDVELAGTQIAITVTSLRNVKNSICSPIKVPFKELISLGTLQAGDYTVKVNGKFEELLSVEEASSQSVDEHLYAAVEYVELGFTGGLSGDASIVGRSVSSCLDFDHVEYISNSKDTYSILPIMKKVSDTCPEEGRRIDIPIKFDLNSLKSDRVLLFVRSVDGKSVQSLINKR